jgi:hypothetical protein
LEQFKYRPARIFISAPVFYPVKLPEITVRIFVRMFLAAGSPLRDED